MKIIIVGAGLSGLTVAYDLIRSGKPGLTVEVFDSSKRAGGLIATEEVDGYLIEKGPEGFLNEAGGALDLAQDLGLAEELLPASKEAKRRYLVRQGNLHPLPMGPGGFLTSPILSVPGRLRVLAEPFAPPRPREEETVYQFARRRIGNEAASVLVDAMVSGIWGGDPKRLSLPAAFPKLAQLERKYGSLFLGMLRRKKTGNGGGPTGPSGGLHSFKNGMETLINELIKKLVESKGAFLHLDRGVERLTTEGNQAVVHVRGRKPLHADLVILALPPGPLAHLLSPISQEAADHVSAIPTAPLAVVATGFTKEAVPRVLDGFGFLAPSAEQMGILGVLWSSATFGGRAPEGKALLRSMIGGVRNPHLVDLPDDALEGIVRRDLGRTMGIFLDPDMIRIYRYPTAIPQYAPGHIQRVATIRSLLSDAGPFACCGTTFDGIGLNPAVRSARKLAQDIIRMHGLSA